MPMCGGSVLLFNHHMTLEHQKSSTGASYCTLVQPQGQHAQCVVVSWQYWCVHSSAHVHQVRHMLNCVSIILHESSSLFVVKYRPYVVVVRHLEALQCHTRIHTSRHDLQLVAIS